jgi:hypothetical protein
LWRCEDYPRLLSAILPPGHEFAEDGWLKKPLRKVRMRAILETRQRSGVFRAAMLGFAPLDTLCGLKMRARYSPEKTKHESYNVQLSRDTETGVVVSEKWSLEGAPQFERVVRRDRETGEITSEKFRAGGLKLTKQYGPQRKPKKRAAPSEEARP